MTDLGRSGFEAPVGDGPTRRALLDLRRENARLRRDLEALAPTVWTDVSFQNSWANDGGDPDVQYRKIGDIVYLRGRASGGATGTVAFQLPVGFRPQGNTRLATIANSGIARIDIGPGGNVEPNNQVSGTDVNAGVQFDDVCFSTL